MSTLTGETQSQTLSSERDLLHYFESFAKPRECIRVGLEAEFFPVNQLTGHALPYNGEGGVEAVLKALARRFHYDSLLEEGRVIALKRGDSMITLEPGGQMELSAPPVFNVFEIEEQLRSFLGELRSLHDEFPDTAWLAVGIHPFDTVEQVGWVPKRRYRIMADHFKTHGAFSHQMMKLTATNQINFDYLSEENAMTNLRVSLGITSIVTALFAHSSFSEGRPNGFLSRRLEIWNHTDPDRSGLIVSSTRPGRTFKDYLDYLLDMPMIFIVRQAKWIPVNNLSFRSFIEKGYEGERATLGDFELHLSSAFPEARLKQYLEIRGVDCQSPDLIPAVAAFWKGILYNAAACEKAWKLVSFASEADRLNLHASVARQGLGASLGSKPILPIARELVELSCASLAKQIRRDESRNECIFLDRIRQKITRPGKSPAETLLEKWNGELAQDPRRLIEYLRAG